jgi:radical SAM superfamily enzyme YgiQ (UPF0313 family)
MGYFMLGFPTETYEEASETIEFALRSSLHRAVFLKPIPFAGTELSEMAVATLNNRNVTLAPLTMGYQTSNLNISAMSDLELRRIFKNVYRRFYMNPKRIAGLLKMAIQHPYLFSLERIAKMFLIAILPRKHSVA